MHLYLMFIVTVSYVTSCYGFTLGMLIGFYCEARSMCMEQFFLLGNNVTLSDSVQSFFVQQLQCPLFCKEALRVSILYNVCIFVCMLSIYII